MVVSLYLQSKNNVNVLMFVISAPKKMKDMSINRCHNENAVYHHLFLIFNFSLIVGRIIIPQTYLQ